ncbi:hypothetical protein PWT90_07374 [Aphanocladium album]|nr:hypothetical protein PWT90_07374 [Aphanocladium album]
MGMPYYQTTIHVQHEGVAYATTAYALIPSRELSVLNERDLSRAGVSFAGPNETFPKAYIQIPYNNETKYYFAPRDMPRYTVPNDKGALFIDLSKQYAKDTVSRDTIPDSIIKELIRDGLKSWIGKLSRAVLDPNDDAISSLITESSEYKGIYAQTEFGRESACKLYARIPTNTHRNSYPDGGAILSNVNYYCYWHDLYLGGKPNPELDRELELYMEKNIPFDDGDELEKARQVLSTRVHVEALVRLHQVNYSGYMHRRNAFTIFWRKDCLDSEEICYKIIATGKTLTPRCNITLRCFDGNKVVFDHGNAYLSPWLNCELHDPNFGKYKDLMSRSYIGERPDGDPQWRRYALVLLPEKTEEPHCSIKITDLLLSAVEPLPTIKMVELESKVKPRQAREAVVKPSRTRSKKRPSHSRTFRISLSGNTSSNFAFEANGKERNVNRGSIVDRESVVGGDVDNKKNETEDIGTKGENAAEAMKAKEEKFNVEKNDADKDHIAVVDDERLELAAVGDEAKSGVETTQIDCKTADETDYQSADDQTTDQYIGLGNDDDQSNAACIVTTSSTGNEGYEGSDDGDERRRGDGRLLDDSTSDDGDGESIMGVVEGSIDTVRFASLGG